MVQFLRVIGLAKKFKQKNYNFGIYQNFKR